MATAVRRPESHIVESYAISDIDALRGIVADGLQTECVQLEARPFRARWEVVRFPSVVVQFGREAIALVRHLRVPPDRWAFVVPLVVPASLRWNGCVVGGRELIVCRPQADGYFFEPAGTCFAVITIPIPADSTVSGALDTFAEPSPATVIRPRAKRVQALRARLGRLGASTGTETACDSSSIMARLTDSLLGCLERARPVSACTTDVRSQIVQRAETFFRTHVGESVPMARLSEVAGVSERSLRNAFRHVYTTSPKRYLRIWLLHQVRRALRAEPCEATVTDVATCHGFYELGRFAGEYKAFFGEAPSQTLQNARLLSLVRSRGAA